MKSHVGLAGVLALSTLAGCAVNPATGRREISLVGEGQEIQMGREADQQIAVAIGLYDDERLQAYVSDIGLRLAAASERPDLPWTFRVLDDASVNALALPGGFVYVTRGMLSHMTSEAQLAGVLGHEIGHVTAKHAVSRISKAQLANLGLGLGMILKPELQDFGGLAQTGLGLLFLKHSRDDERQADELGIRYMTARDYDPSPVPDVFRMLERLGEDAGKGRVPGWLSTHPDPGERAQRITQIVAGLPPARAAGAIREDAFLARIDGMVFGIDPREGYFDDGRFYHPGLRFQLDMPQGWETSNQKQAVSAMSPNRDAVMVLTLARRESPSQAAREFFSQQGIRQGPARRGEIHGMEAVVADFQAQTQQGVVQGVVGFVEHDGRVYQLLGYAAASRWGRYDDLLGRAVTSFDRLSDPGRLNVQPQRVEIVHLPRTLSVGEFERRYPTGVPESTLALINQVPPGGSLAGSVKTVVGRSFGAQQALTR